MKLTLAVLVALGVTMAWQASVVADNNNNGELAPQLTVDRAVAATPNQAERG